MSSTVIDAETGVIERYEPPTPTTLFHTSDPDQALQRMGAVAKTLVDVIEKTKLYATINGHRHITAEGWTTLGGMLGVHAIVTETRANDSGDGIVARAEARTLDGRVVGAAEAECSRAERKWKTVDPFAIRSMAQTRAISRALRAPLGQIVVLAGYKAAGAEETPQDEPQRSAAAPVSATRDQFDEIKMLLSELDALDPGTDWRARAVEIAGVPGRMLTCAGAVFLIEKLEDEVEGLRSGE